MQAMIPVTVTIQYERDGAKKSSQVRLSLDMTVATAIETIVEALGLPPHLHYTLTFQRQTLAESVKLFMVGVQDGGICQLTAEDARATIMETDSGRNNAAGLLQRLGGKGASEPLPIRAALITVNGDVMMLNHTRALIGRADDRVGYGAEMFDVELTALDPNRSVSRPHAMIVYADGGFTIRDLYSRHGVSVNGKPLSPSASQPIHDGDVLSIGEVELQFRCEVTGKG
jgi:hypothetical protein